MSSTTAVTASGLEAILSDDEAFERWYARTVGRVYAFLYHRCGGRSDVAEELTQQTFVAAIRHAADHGVEVDALPWLFGIARHKLADHYRRLERDRRLDERVAVRAIPTAEGAFITGEQREAIDAALRTLPPLHRLVLLLRFLDRQPVREIAALLGRSEDAAESLLRRAREMFVRAYEEQTHAH